MKEQIADYLAQGYKAVQVAQFCGCTEQYISELLKEDERFKEILREKMREHIGTRLANRYDALEEKTLAEITNAINNNMLEVADLTRILESIARIKNANKSVIPPGHHSNPTVGLTLIFPAEQQPRLITDEKNRVISIGDKTMVPMPAKAVRDIFTKRAKEEANDHVTIEQLAS